MARYWSLVALLACLGRIGVEAQDFSRKSYQPSQGFPAQEPQPQQGSWRPNVQQPSQPSSHFQTSLNQQPPQQQPSQHSKKQPGQDPQPQPQQRFQTSYQSASQPQYQPSVSQNQQPPPPQHSKKQPGQDPQPQPQQRFQTSYQSSSQPQYQPSVSQNQQPPPPQHSKKQPGQAPQPQPQRFQSQPQTQYQPPVSQHQQPPPPQHSKQQPGQAPQPQPQQRFQSQPQHQYQPPASQNQQPPPPQYPKKQPGQAPQPQPQQHFQSQPQHQYQPSESQHQQPPPPQYSKKQPGQAPQPQPQQHYQRPPQPQYQPSVPQNQQPPPPQHSKQQPGQAPQPQPQQRFQSQPQHQYQPPVSQHQQPPPPQHSKKQPGQAPQPQPQQHVQSRPQYQPSVPQNQQPPPPQHSKKQPSQAPQPQPQQHYQSQPQPQYQPSVSQHQQPPPPQYSKKQPGQAPQPPPQQHFQRPSFQKQPRQDPQPQQHAQPQPQYQSQSPQQQPSKQSQPSPSRFSYSSAAKGKQWQPQSGVFPRGFGSSQVHQQPQHHQYTDSNTQPSGHYQPQASVQVCEVPAPQRVPCGGSDISAAGCEAISCCFDGQQCYFGRAVTVHCTRDAQFIVVVGKDVTLPNIDLETVSLLEQGQGCTHVAANSAFAIYQFPVTACGSVIMEEPGVIIYENRMTSSYEVSMGEFGSITRDTTYDLMFQCRYIGANVESVVVEVMPLGGSPLPVAAWGPIRVELRLANGECYSKGCNEMDVAYSSYYDDGDYPVRKVLREPVYVEVQLMEKTDHNIALTLGRCWTTQGPNPHSLPQWDILVDGCPYRSDPYLSSLVPVDSSSGLEFPSHYKRFMFKMFTFVDTETFTPLGEQIYIHCSTTVCSGGNCEPSCLRRKRDLTSGVPESPAPKVVATGGPVIFESAETV